MDILYKLLMMLCFMSVSGAAVYYVGRDIYIWIWGTEDDDDMITFTHTKIYDHNLTPQERQRELELHEFIEQLNDEVYLWCQNPEMDYDHLQDIMNRRMNRFEELYAESRKESYRAH
jgi:hypothetical protein